jgi:Snf7
MGNVGFCKENKGPNKEFSDSYNGAIAGRDRTITDNTYKPKARNFGGVATPSANSSSNSKQRRATVTDHEIITAKIHLQIEKIEERNKTLETKENDVDARIKELVAQKRKEEAYFALSKKKSIKQTIKQNLKKIDILESQIMNIENSVAEVGFTNALGASNVLLQKLNDEMDLDEVRIAKELQQQGKLRREELMELVEDDEAEEIKNEIDRLELEMLKSNLSKEQSQTNINSNVPAPQKAISEVQVQSLS